MTIPNLPTDNLYKFTFLGGLTIVIASCILFLTQYNLLSDKIDTISLSSAELETELNFIGEDINFIAKETLKMKTNLKGEDTVDIYADWEALSNKLEKDKNFREYYSFLLEHKEDVLPYRKQFVELESMTNKIDSLNRKSIATKNILKEKLQLIKKEYRMLVILSIVCCAFIFIGGKMAIKGHKDWLNLVQKPADEKARLELRQLKESLEKKPN
jgi:hypothetical protein